MIVLKGRYRKPYPEHKKSRYVVARVCHSASNFMATGERWVPDFTDTYRATVRSARKKAIKRGKNYMVWDIQKNQWASPERDFQKFLDGCRWIKRQYCQDLPWCYRDNT